MLWRMTFLVFSALLFVGSSLPATSDHIAREPIFCGREQMIRPSQEFVEEILEALESKTVSIMKRANPFKYSNIAEIESEAVPQSLCNLDLRGFDFQGRIIGDADFRLSDLSYANFSGSQLVLTNFEGAKLLGVDMSGANLDGAWLDRTDLTDANLSNAYLGNASLNYSTIHRTALDNVNLSWAELHHAKFTPLPDLSSQSLWNLRGLRSVTFERGNSAALVSLRDSLQKIGNRSAEREATFAIEHGITMHLLCDWRREFGSIWECDLNPRLSELAEGFLRLVFFELTTGYGLHPGRALIVLVTFIWIFSLVYSLVTITNLRSDGKGAIFRIWHKGRIDLSSGALALADSEKIEKYRSNWLQGYLFALYYSILSAFHIGWRDLNVGGWVTRLQGREFELRGFGWVRTVSGLQSLFSVYLLAIWVLTYFGRPFQ